MKRSTVVVSIAILSVIASLSLLSVDIVTSASYSEQGTPICTASGEQEWEYPSYKRFVVCSDGSGGAVITWQDKRNGAPNADIYAQRIDSSGVTQWTSNGVPICTATNTQRRPVITSDGSGGAIIAWQDRRNDNQDIYAQRVDSSGVTQWTPDGVAICTAGDNQDGPTIVSDGSGGAIIAWDDTRNFSSTDYDIYAQRVDTDGNVKWTLDGVPICTNPAHQMVPIIVGDGSGGAIVVWQDSRIYGRAVYSQRIDPLGITQWTSDGVAATTATHTVGGEVGSVAVAADGAGGAIIAWGEHQENIYAQRLDSSGIKQWDSDGLAVCTSPDRQAGPALVCDDSGGAIITWHDLRNGYDEGSVYAQMVDSGGNIAWTSNGVAIGAVANGAGQAVITTDGSGGGIIVWRDYRNCDYDIYAQRVDSSGVTQWTSNGVPICTATNTQRRPVITSDGSGGAIIAWLDNRSGVGSWSYSDIYAKRVDADGSPAAPVPTSPCGCNVTAQCTATSTGTGTASFAASAGNITALTAVITPCDAPVSLPHGMFSFNITGLNASQSVTVTVELPDPVPVGTKWWKYQNGSWYPLDIGSDDGDESITFVLTDNGLGDEDSIPGQITDDGGPGNPGAVGWEIYPTSKTRVLLPWIALLAAAVVGASLLVLRRRHSS